MRAKLVAVVAAACLLAGGAFAQHNQGNVTFGEDGRPNNMQQIPPKRGLNETDRWLMQQAYNSNEFEILAGRIAMRKGGTWGREFGRDMVREHTLAKNELRQLGRETRVRFQTRLPQDKRMMLAQLERAPRGDGFDQVYRDIMIRAHNETAFRFKQGIDNGNDSRVRNYAVKHLPGVLHHKEMATQRATVTRPHAMAGR
jgi:putative membrane protein